MCFPHGHTYGAAQATGPAGGCHPHLACGSHGSRPPRRAACCRSVSGRPAAHRWVHTPWAGRACGSRGPHRRQRCCGTRWSAAPGLHASVPCTGRAHAQHVLPSSFGGPSGSWVATTYRRYSLPLRLSRTSGDDTRRPIRLMRDRAEGRVVENACIRVSTPPVRACATYAGGKHARSGRDRVAEHCGDCGLIYGDASPAINTSAPVSADDATHEQCVRLARAPLAG